MSVSQKPNKTGKPSDRGAASEKSGAGDEAHLSVEADELENALDNGPSAGNKAAQRERTCIVTRKAQSPDEMIRFVLSPDNVVTPDVNAKLPGRGVWITANRSYIEEAVKKSVFARGFKTNCTCPADLADQVDEIMSKFVLGTLSMARASGGLIQGFSKVDSMIRNNEAAIVLEAKDGSEDGLRKIMQAVRFLEAFDGDPPKVVQLFTSAEMDFGASKADSAASQTSNEGSNLGSNVIHMALTKTPSARAARKRVKRLIAYRGIQAVDASPVKGSNSSMAGGFSKKDRARKAKKG